jgi:peptidoglycan/xylan/chitin deacetylase (PgdA/CDA1 family)
MTGDLQFRWPHGYRAAFSLTFDLDAESVVLAVDMAYAKRPSIMTHQAYGPLTGLPRLLGLLRERGVRATFFVPGYTADRHPQAVAAIVEDGHEVGHHGYLHRPPAQLGIDEERSELERGLLALERFGVSPTGFRAPWWDTSTNTFTLLAEHGFSYDASLFDRDIPYLIETPRGSIVEIPQSWALDDWERYAYLPDPPAGLGGIEPPTAVMDIWWEEMLGYRHYGGCCVPVMHPFLSGRPARALALGEFIDRLKSVPDLWIATMDEIADHTRSLDLTPQPLDLPDPGEVGSV